MDSLASPSNSFGFRLFAHLHAAQRGGNLLLSPPSVYLALAALCGGASGQTRQEIALVLGIDGWPEGSVPDAVARLLGDFDPPPARPVVGSRPGASTDRIEIIPAEPLYPTVRLVTAVWFQRGVKPTQAFEEVLRTKFRAESAEIDFADPAVPAIVNAWVSEHTEGRIDHLVDRFDPLQLLCVATAFFFQGAWSFPFEPEHTTPQPFHRGPDTSLVPMMRQDTLAAYADHPDAQVIALSYQGRDMELLIVLPALGSSLASVVGTLDAPTWDRWLGGLQGRVGTIALPRFAVQPSAAIELTAALAALGVVRLTDPSGAELDGLFAETPVPAMPVFLGQMLHGAMLAVDEAGTVAAAATAEWLAGGIPPEHSFTMVVDRPFLCAILDRRSGALLFLAAIDDPTATSADS